MIVTCAMCGYNGPITHYEHWIRGDSNMPRVFLCDTHSYYTSRVLLLDPFNESA